MVSQLMPEQQFGSHRIHLCQKRYVNELKQFIDEYWSSNHILSSHQGLMDWLYYDDVREQYNFALARSNKSDEIIGILGFIPTHHFDEDLLDKSVTWLSIWQVRENVEQSGFGLQLLNFVSQYLSPAAVGAIGINDEVARIYRRLKYDVDTLNHYYMVNQSMSNFSLLDNFDGLYNSGVDTSTHVALHEVTESFNEVGAQTDLENSTDDVVPTFSTEYVRNRYVEHPFFDYRLFTIDRDDGKEGILTMRPVVHEESRALRWVEYLGDPEALVGIGSSLQLLLRESGAEYLDIYNAGVDPDLFGSAGMRLRSNNSDIVVPDYFAPFEQKNVDIQYAFKPSQGTEPIIYNGHSDMDRPNRLEDIDE